MVDLVDVHSSIVVPVLSNHGSYLPIFTKNLQKLVSFTWVLGHEGYGVMGYHKGMGYPSHGLRGLRFDCTVQYVPVKHNRGK